MKNVYITKCPYKDQKIENIKQLRLAMDLSLMESKRIVDRIDEHGEATMNVTDLNVLSLKDHGFVIQEDYLGKEGDNMKNVCISECPFPERSRNIDHLAIATGWNEERSTIIIDQVMYYYKAYVDVTTEELIGIAANGFKVRIIKYECCIKEDINNTDIVTDIVETTDAPEIIEALEIADTVEIVDIATDATTNITTDTVDPKQPSDESLSPDAVLRHIDTIIKHLVDIKDYNGIKAILCLLASYNNKF
jgi:hypothetical protein